MTTTNPETTVRDRDRSGFDSIETAIEASRRGELVVILDDTERENEGDLFVPAERVTPEHVNFMVTHARGLVCAPMSTARLDELEMELMVPPEANTESMGTAFTVSVDASTTDTGISAFDRAETIRTLVDPATAPGNLEQPGHVFPLAAAENGLFEREGHTEAAVALAGLAGFEPAGVVCEILSEDGTMARRTELLEFAETHDIAIIAVEDLIDYQRRNGCGKPDQHVCDGVERPEDGRTNRIKSTPTRTVETVLPTEYGEFDLYAYADGEDTHLALVNAADEERPLVRLHSQCLTGDALGSHRCDCGFQLQEVLETIGARGGVLLYLDQEGRDIGLLEKLKAYELQDGAYDTVEANRALGFEPDERDFDVAVGMLRDLGIEKLALLTNNPRKVEGLDGAGLDVERRTIGVERTAENAGYLETKREKLGHRFEP